ncbi:hypothetical protein BST43_25690, partial [Mycobacteroides saopaulense]
GLGTDRINWNGGRLKQADPQVLTIPPAISSAGEWYREDLYRIVGDLKKTASDFEEVKAKYLERQAKRAERQAAKNDSRAFVNNL